VAGSSRARVRRPNLSPAVPPVQRSPYLQPGASPLE
jgi:hypothetical protein